MVLAGTMITLDLVGTSQIAHGAFCSYMYSSGLPLVISNSVP